MKKKTTVLVSFILILGVLASSSIVAQEPPAGQDGKRASISVDVALVDVPFTVTDKKGRSIRNLKRESFKVYEDDRLQTIKNFSAEANLPMTIALLVDTSGSVKERLRFEQEAAVQFFKSALVQKKDRAAVLSFDTRVDLVQDFTDDANVLAGAVRKMRAGGGTALHDAVHLAVTKKLAGEDGRRIIVMITDGDDTSSRLSMNTALEDAQRNDVIIYAISTNSTGLGGEKNKKGDDVLKRFTETTGGKVFFPDKLEDLSSNFNSIREELRFQYALAYSPTNLLRDGAFRRIRIEPANKDHMARARTGYFAPFAPATP